MKPATVDLNELKHGLPDLPGNTKKPLQDSGHVEEAAASGLPSAATASGLAEPAPAIDVKKVKKVKFEDPPQQSSISGQSSDEIPMSEGEKLGWTYTHDGKIFNQDGVRINANGRLWKSRGRPGALRSRGKHRRSRRQEFYAELCRRYGNEAPGLDGDESNSGGDHGGHVPPLVQDALPSLVRNYDHCPSLVQNPKSEPAACQAPAPAPTSQCYAKAKAPPPLCQTPAPTRQHQDKSKSAPACGDAVAAARHSPAAAAAASQPRAEAKTGQVQVNWHEFFDKPHRPPPANRDKQWNEHGGLPEAARGKQWDEHGGLPEAARGKQWNEHGGQRWDEYRRWADQTAGSEESDNRSQRKDQRRGTQDIRKGNFGPLSSASDDFPDWFSRVWDYKHKYNSNGDIYDVVPKDPRTGIELEGNLRTQFERWAKQKR